MSLLFCLFGYTFDPMEPARKDIKRLKTNHANWIKFYKSGDKDMSYVESGNPTGRPVLFVHGSPGSKEAWYSFHLDPELQEKFHLLSVDRPGFGQSSPGITERSVEQQAKDIWKLLEKNHSKQLPIIVGHSYGGAVIARIASDYSTKVHAALFVASSVDPNLEETKFIQHIGNLWLIRSLIPTDLRVCNEEILALKESLLKINWKKIRAHIGIIHGTNDELVPIENVDFILKNITASQIKLITRIEQMNHFIPWHKSETIKDAVLKLDQI